MYRRQATKPFTKRKKPSFEIGGTVKEIREDYPPEVRDFLDKHGEEKITSIKVGRTPLSGVVKNVLNIISLGALKKAIRKAGIDSIYHLYLIINNKYRLEKNQVISFSNYRPQGKDEQVVDVPFDKDITIQEFVDNAIKGMGKLDYFTYGAFGNRNCQGFVLGHLRSSGITAPLDFIKQDVDTILENTPSYLPKVTNLITDVAGALDLIRQRLRKIIPFEEGGLVL
jgi:hypothetical protein